MTIQEILEEDQKIRARAIREQRPLTPEEAGKISALFDLADVISTRDDSLPLLAGRPDPQDHPGTRIGSSSSRGGGPVADRSYRGMFGNVKLDSKDFETFGDFAVAATIAGQTGVVNPLLLPRAALTEGVPSDGGFLVPEPLAADVFDVALESEIVRPRAQVWSLRSATLKIPASVIGDHSTNVFGGMVAYYKNEAGSLTAAEPKFREMELTAWKLTVYGKGSTEWFQDAIVSERYLQSACAAALGWYSDVNYLNGDGAGKPMGVLNAACTISVAKETAQLAATIVYDNVTKMLSRLNPGSFGNAVWVCHPTTIPQLLSLSIPVGTGGSHIPLVTKSAGVYSMLTLPILFSEKAATLGTSGDIILADFSQYVVGLRKELRFETTKHASFTTDEIDYRCIIRHDGQPLWSEALTLRDGTTTVSPFVVLETRG